MVTGIQMYILAILSKSVKMELEKMLYKNSEIILTIESLRILNLSVVY